jgi:hypothetical protein
MLPGPTSVSEGLHPGEVHVEHRREEAKVRKGLAVKPNPVIHEEPVKPGETPAPEAIKPVAVEPIATPPPVPESIAPEPKVEAAIAPKVETAPTRVWKDGTYTGWGYSRHGDIEAEVVIAGGRILSATISQCRTRYSCSVVEKFRPRLPRAKARMLITFLVPRRARTLSMERWWLRLERRCPSGKAA